MPLHLFYTMVQKSQKWPKTQIKGGGGSCLKTNTNRMNNSLVQTFAGQMVGLECAHCQVKKKKSAETNTD